ncbi:Rieske (2Fe-2S) protein [Ponticoccus sp. SC2-23]|uniref:Rieske (2Fe-2S) protein n=1 Tax=Alexandriicola marinus TaxID=2081710 RepID=UPI0013DF9036|nr:Rieske (2Fe-2S) protein [Alexandriicola marinus]MBM1221291.1 Rieske (2Fe-2S) protein [Ponticoccus sp. SC6-9]MBM1225861.1 Rieske (2Fe-2S) protein [Ponticoccus sp. SC6-15]MBM1228013.1 Rieske (2Fe-2S) protein [Ponticoccus sp. SC6-38]MBM1234349.1 Rieske (2Fe-2S) protein [Ponticoccus sp. SC6-45]MBM1238515.1 Rieske (2Fe-2S) protein [Ponticoccus sp. SC6-49]MBM1243784.1 Rieske (2Fe-2S) protein [Ponticoccus sp. SC2-64]MBM1247873.1 Rieske (2Fe-2S) protein [Ponticoccus sp. SC6-42]MBM1252915.1 Riesk
MTTRPVGLTRDLPAGRVMHAQADGKDMVVWRATDGTIAAWDNRCPHRGMALSHGFVRGNRLACLYHGWHYDRSGRCGLIPAHPDLEPPATIHATQYGVVETGGVIWVSADEAPAPDDSDLAPLRSFIVEASEDALRDAQEATSADGAPPAPEASDRVSVLCNPIEPGRTQVTVLTAPGLPLPRLRTLSRWCEAMRRQAEAKETA